MSDGNSETRYGEHEKKNDRNEGEKSHNEFDDFSSVF